MMRQMKALEDRNRRLKRMFADPSMQADLRRAALGKKCHGQLGAASWPRVGRELAEKAGATKGGSIALAGQAFGLSETCFRYSPKRDDETEMIAERLVGLSDIHKTWGFGLCFLHLRMRQRACLEPQAGPPDLLRA